MKSFTLEVVRVKASFPWAIRATFRGQIRYRGYRYKAEALKSMEDWIDCEDWFFGREFYHNFDSAETLSLSEVKR